MVKETWENAEVLQEKVEEGCMSSQSYDDQDGLTQ